MLRPSTPRERGKRSRRKGLRVEREFAALVGGVRVPLSGALGGSLVGDVRDSTRGLVWEVKARASGWVTLYNLLAKPGIDALALRRDNHPWLVVVPLSVFLRLTGVSEDTQNG